METSIAYSKTGIDEAIYASDVVTGKLSRSRIPVRPVVGNALGEENDDFCDYVKNQGIAGESDFIILPANHHYFYDENDMTGIRMVINLQRLNLIRHLDSFFKTLAGIMNSGTSFVGCFSDVGSVRKNNVFSSDRISVLIKRLNNFLDSRTDHSLDKDGVFELLKFNGFRILDMTEINGLTYFYSRKSRITSDLKA